MRGRVCKDAPYYRQEIDVDSFRYPPRDPRRRFGSSNIPKPSPPAEAPFFASAPRAPQPKRSYWAVVEEGQEPDLKSNMIFRDRRIAEKAVALYSKEGGPIYVVIEIDQGAQDKDLKSKVQPIVYPELDDKPIYPKQLSVFDHVPQDSNRRIKNIWKVINAELKVIERFPYNQRTAADQLATELAQTSGMRHYVCQETVFMSDDE